MSLIDKESWLAKRGVVWAGTVALLLLVGMLVAPLQRNQTEVLKPVRPETDLKNMEKGLGHGVVLGVLGGFRTLAADLVFISAFTHWQEKDLPKVEALSRLTVTIDPEPTYFWLNAARMFAFDFPHWRVQQLGGLEEVPEAVWQEIVREQAWHGIAFLQEALKYHPDEARLMTDIGLIAAEKLKDYQLAADYYLKAWEANDQFYFAARIYSRMLRNMGKDEEAYEFLKQHFNEIFYDDWQSQKGYVLELIRECERDLSIPYYQRFRPDLVVDTEMKYDQS